MKRQHSPSKPHRRLAVVLGRNASALLPACAPLRHTRQSLAIVAALMLAVAASSARAESTASTRAATDTASRVKTTAQVTAPVDQVQSSVPLVLPMGRAMKILDVAAGATFRIEGDAIITAAIEDGTLLVTSQRIGTAVLIVSAPNHASQTYSVRVYEPSSNAQTLKSAIKPRVENATITKGGAPKANSASLRPRVTQRVLSAVALRARSQKETRIATKVAARATMPGFRAPAAVKLISTFAAPLPEADENLYVTTLESAQISPSFSPSLPPPTRNAAPGAVNYRVNRGKVPARTGGVRPSNAVPVTRGLARFFRFESNILAVFYSDIAVMDARAVNARTVAITGIAPGASTLAVFTSRYEGDAVGKPHIYQISVRPSTTGSTITAPVSTTSELESAIRAAIGDSRISVGVLQLPNGTTAARLSGIVRDAAEAEAAKSSASLFVPSVISSIYVDKSAPTAEAFVMSSVPDEQKIQDQLRQLMDNTSISVTPFNNGLAVRATVNSPEEADQLLNALSTLGRPVTPFIVIRGATSETPAEIYDRPVLSGEDAAITRRLQAVTGVRTVYAVKVTGDALKTDNYGIAIYGTVRNRREYDRVRRYAPLLTSQAGVSGGAETGTIEQALRSNLPTTGGRAAVGIQMFVRILNGDDSIVRKVTVETNIVEINRTSLKNLGVEFGSVAVTGESVALGNPGTTVTGPGGTTTTGATPTVITRQIDPTFLPGQLTGSNGFAGGGAFQSLNPLRVRLNALYQNGNARILSSPNITAVEGADAQMVIGGTRPIPFTNTTGGGAGSVQTSVVFRNYGILLSMRPTVTDDDTILLQIRAEVTGLDSTTSINLNGTIIPGETTRGINTTLTVREGDTIVLGGIMTNERNERTSRIPVLSQLPIIGSLFKSKRFENNQTELAIFMTPRISRQAASEGTVSTVERAPGLPNLPSSTGEAVNFGGAGGTTAP